ncbi:Type II secretion system protein E [Rubripirellula lacrimiformis]|uniref:Type II secretion system protein E n=1 Tax=Rubripirellula lacrimiformis TaxID=1930273 RepID=A0A517NG98_9BACT|nr:GspE/PulE family protein [Rubripirellula lacrimiformis]QDT06156.1 Type II secretion system protein E [Rubripirellula lacrimiformis]
MITEAFAIPVDGPPIHQPPVHQPPNHPSRISKPRIDGPPVHEPPAIDSRSSDSHKTDSSVSDPLIVRLIHTLNQMDPDRLGRLYETADQNDVPFEQLAIENGLADERFIAEAYANHYLLPLFDPPSDCPPPIDVSLCKVLPAELCCQHLVAPLSDDGQTIEVAVFSPDSLLLADEIRLITGRQMRPFFTTLSVMRKLLAVMYGNQSLTQATPPKISAPPPAGRWFSEAVEHGSCGALQPPAARYLSELIDHVLGFGASDVHIEPAVQGHRVRVRLDGALDEFAPPSPEWSESMVTHLVSRSQIEVADIDMPQEGAFQLCRGKRQVDVRVHTCPTHGGRKTVLHLTDHDSLPSDLLSLGMRELDRRILAKTLSAEKGLVLVSGPTGSGKSVTLAACLDYRNDHRTNLCTVEENIDLPLPGVNQIRIRPDQGLTYSMALRGVLRQDPDVILVGELDCDQTAADCMRASSSGRLVLSALREANSVGCLGRLAELNVRPANIARNLAAIVSQRMVRRLCPDCKDPHPISAELAKKFGIDPNQTMYRDIGCRKCRQSGYRGKFPVFEVIRVSPKIAELIRTRANPAAIRRAAVGQGTRLLRQAAIDQAVAGETSLKAAFATFGTR